ncbi:hypothetical protein [Pseudooceanicola spongiae]|uniref:Shikimate dehydrogenase substrate binding N-terminal domain-containing protein n=1 Tax=Pseudooceanicola spongiae TaxID=2613965 RepID=A0A7L9WJU8_9RHOB|nr:hypothetical protein [Pseudooceanicola spongiae]QOL79636.1 hypothetical protein F3W81_01600 [Pseudooceanicola spongiae]
MARSVPVPQPQAVPLPLSALSGAHRQVPLRLGLAGDPGPTSRAGLLLTTKAQAWRLPLILHPFPETGLTPAALLAEARTAQLSALHLIGPLTEAMLPLLDDLSPMARQQGAVDLILFRNGQATGVNTGAWARKRAMTRFLAPLPRAQALLLGAGLRGRAAACALASAGVKSIAIFDPRRDRALALSLFLTQGSGMRSTTLPSLDSFCDRRFDGIIRAIPHAMPNALIRPGNLSPRHWIIDTDPEGSGLTELAGTLGCNHLSGRDIAQLQARRLLDHLTSATQQPTSEGLRTARPFPYRRL